MKDDLFMTRASSMPILHDPAAVAAAESAKARIQAAYIMAMQKPRSEEQARQRILAACKRPQFASRVEYSKPIAGTKIKGPSIRFAELALREWGNIDSDIFVMFEDAQTKRIKIRLLDCETNAAFSKEITVKKTVERRSDKDREVVGQRTNTNGDTVYIVLATEDECNNKENAAISKALRNEGLRLIPSDIIDEALDVARNTMRAQDAADPAAAKKAVLDSFAALGIMPVEVEKYLDHKLDIISPSELEDLRSVYRAIREGEASWSDYIDVKKAKSEQRLDELKKKVAEEKEKKAPKDSAAPPAQPVEEFPPEPAATASEPQDAQEPPSPPATVPAEDKKPDKPPRQKREPQKASESKPDSPFKELDSLNAQFKALLQSNALKAKAALLNAKLNPKIQEFGNVDDARKFFESFKALSNR